MMHLFIQFLSRSVCILMFATPATLMSSPAFAHEFHGDHDEEPTAEQLRETDITALIRAFRETGDDKHLDRAWTLIEPLLDTTPIDADILVNAALVAQARHAFSKATDLTKKAIAIRPNDNQAWLLLASIHLVRGESAQAKVACRQLRNVPLLVTMTCQARVALSENNASRVYSKFARILTVAGQSGQDSQQLAWSLSVAGDLAKATDNLAVAKQHYTRSLELVESTQVRSALADVLIEEGDIDFAAQVIDAGSPALPLEIRRMIVAKQLGHDVARDIHRADLEFRHWIENEDWLHSREMARFYIDVLERPKLAQRLTHINLSQQREPEDLLLAHRARKCSSCVH